jgi:hypothetical protein
VIKAAFTQDASIGEHQEPKYRLQISKEHASQLYRILRETHLTAADWLARVISEELRSLGYSAELPDETTQTTIAGPIGQQQQPATEPENPQRTLIG